MLEVLEQPGCLSAGLDGGAARQIRELDEVVEEEGYPSASVENKVLAIVRSAAVVRYLSIANHMICYFI